MFSTSLASSTILHIIIILSLYPNLEAEIILKASDVYLSYTIQPKRSNIRIYSKDI